MPALFPSPHRQNFDSVRAVRICWDARAKAFVLDFDLQRPISADWLLGLSVGLVHESGRESAFAHIDWREARSKAIKAQLMFDQDLSAPFTDSERPGAPFIKEVRIAVQGTRIERRFPLLRD